MKVLIQTVENAADERVVIECVRVTPDVEAIRAFAAVKGEELTGMGESGMLTRVPLTDVCYFEAVDEKCFACTDSAVYEIRMRLYEAEEVYADYDFVRCSKSVVLNLMKLDGLRPALAGRYTACMKNGENLVVSRKYAPALIRLVMGEENG